MSKIINVYVDTETTGLDPEKHSIVEIAMIFEREGEVTDTFQLFIKPYTGQFEVEALDKIKKTIGELEERGVELALARIQLTNKLKEHCDPYNKLDKMKFIAYNANFDKNFLFKFMETEKYKYAFLSYFWMPFIDTYSLAGVIIGDERVTMPNFKLGTVCEQFGIEFDEDKAHGALYDTDRTRLLHRQLMLYVRAGKAKQQESKNLPF